jgi:hypothetical protein
MKMKMKMKSWKCTKCTTQITHAAETKPKNGVAWYVEIYSGLMHDKSRCAMIAHSLFINIDGDNG